ncbi:hypothetical protein [Fluviicola sp.]|uniref:hypothetical protein n=1 Tax=Fluviicola sp. TaxID=1917219 RepID=UPI0031D2C516
MEKGTKYLLIGAGVLALGTGGYFLYQHLTKKGTQEAVDDFTEKVEDNQLPTGSGKPKIPSGYKPKPATTTFPIKMKSKGALVKNVQSALLKKYPEALPKYGADGYFGKELQTALTKHGISTTIDKELYDQILSGKAFKGSGNDDSNETPLSPDSIADLLYSGIIQTNIDTCLRALWKIKGVKGYTKVNEVFKTKRIDGVRKTIATALSHAFPDDPERKKYRAQLYTIGLKWRNDQWALSGLSAEPENRLITVKRTKIWDNTGNFLMIPNGTIIGTLLSAKNGLTEFLTIDGRNLFVDTTAIRYHHD